jgi:hypothetical protein
MGIYLSQLPPPEIARFKAELAETIIANFCYPRFFDYRTESLQTRPIDRTKRHEVWLYLSSVDFTAWSRIDLMSADFPRHIERLFIQFVQRNRSFFGTQGRRRMLDIRLSISTCARAVAQRLCNHLTGQQNTPAFGSPRPALSWTATPISGRPEPAWEQVMVSSMELQQQLQQWRGEVPTAAVEEPVLSGSRTSSNARSSQAEVLTSAPNTINSPNGQGYRQSRPQQVPVNPANPMNPAASLDHASIVAQQPTTPTSPVTKNPSQPLAHPGQYSRGSVAPASNPAVASAIPVAPVSPNNAKTPVKTASGSLSAPTVIPRRPSGNLAQPVEQPPSARQSGGAMRSRSTTSPSPVVSPARPPVPAVEPSPASVPPSSPTVPTRPAEAQPVRGSSVSAVSAKVAPTPSAVRTSSAAGFSTSPTTTDSQRELFTVGEDDLAIFEQMRYQLVLWLRIEAISAGLEISGQVPPTQLLEMLRQQARYDETRLQIVSTLLNLVNQVMKTGTVSVLDYKQALTFHLMHTKRP